MFPDLYTLLLCDALVTVFIGIALLFYKSTQFAYPGFGFWVSGTFILFAGFAFSFLRSIVPEPIGIFITNLLFGVGAVIRLDGIHRFMRRRGLPGFIYASPAFLIIESACFYFIIDSFVIRNFFISLYLSLAIAALAVILFRCASESGRLLCRVLAILQVVFGITLAFQAVMWLLNPGDFPAERNLFYSVHYLIVTMYEVGMGLGLLMMNGQRLEYELRNSESNLRHTVVQLKTAISEIKTLGGLVPICASCKRIRDDQGFWNHVEVYIAEHTDARFSHGICPECTKNLYPDVNLTSK